MNDRESLIRILHLSDIHLGTSSEADRYFTQLSTDLTQNLHLDRLDYLIVSGDIVHYSTPPEYDAAFQLINDIQKRYHLDSDRIVVVPGNHDVNWPLGNAAYAYSEDSPEFQAEYKKRFDYFSEHFYQKIYNRRYPLEYREQAIIYANHQDRILFLGLNSCWQIDGNEEHKEYRYRSGIHPNAISFATRNLSRDYEDWLKIAVWHHPVNGSETMKDTAFLELLADRDFQIGIHGHIHEAQNEYFRHGTQRGLHIIGAGTFGAPLKEQVTGIPLQYNLLELDKNLTALTVNTRKKEKVNGSWSADARWGDRNHPEPQYTITLESLNSNSSDPVLTESSELNYTIQTNLSETKPASRILPKFPEKPDRKTLVKISTASFGVTLLIIIIRFLGGLQWLELKTYDFLMRSRFVQDRADPRIRVIKITRDDIQKYGRDQKTVGKATLPDDIYAQLFTQLKQYEAKTIGLDIYREHSVTIDDSETQKFLKQSLETDSNLFVICKALDPSSDSQYFTPPPEVPIVSRANSEYQKQRIGFSDFVADPDGIVRRHLLRMNLADLSGNECRTDHAFNVLLALHFLDIKPKPMLDIKNNSIGYENDRFGYNDLNFTPIQNFYGGYQDINAGGHQVFLNYRALTNPRNIARAFTLDEVLQDEQGRLKNDFENKIVLIGITDPNNQSDLWATPYGEAKIPGVFLHAHKVSQVLDFIEEERSLLWVLPWFVEWFAIAFLGMLGGGLMWLLSSRREKILASVVIPCFWAGLCWLVFAIAGGWLPVIPAILSFVGTSIIFSRLYNKGEKAP